MKISGVISIVGSVIAVAFGYVNFARLFLVNSTASDYVALAIVSTLLALVGSLPGFLIGHFITPRNIAPTKPSEASDENPTPPTT